MKKRSIRTIYGLAIILAGLMLFAACPVQAALITIQISGEITSVAGTGRDSVSDTIYAGVTFTGTYTYDSSTLDSDSDPHIGKYLHDSPYGISISLGGYEFKTASTHTDDFVMWILNDDTSDGINDLYAVVSDENVSDPSVDFEVDTIIWDLRDNTYDALSSDALPVTAPVLNLWDYNRLSIYGGNAGEGYVNFGIIGTVTQATPEPMTVFILAFGGLLLRNDCPLHKGSFLV